MVKLNLFRSSKKIEPHIDIYYHEMNPAIKRVVESLRQERPVLYGTSGEEKVRLELDSIYYFDTVDKKVFAYTKNQVYQIHQTLTSLEKLLEEYRFVRISKSNLVNLLKISRIKPEVNMRVVAVFDNGERLYINRSYKKNFEEYLMREKGVICE